MNYYEVQIASLQFHGSEPLTYMSEEKLTAGTVVAAPLKNRPALGIVRRTVQKPSFATKPITGVVHATPLPAQLLQLLDWLPTYYPAPHGVITQQFLPRTLLQQSRSKPGPVTSQPSVAPLPLPPLTDEQQLVINQINTESSRSFLLHGETGSGKTRIYMELAKEELAKGRSILVLVPEISLTPQLALSFTEAFQETVVVIHSNLTDAERRKIWLAILDSKEPLVIIGPRSALFTPIAKLGLIIVDESHDTAYKQDQAPYYHAARVAARLAQLHQAKFILGSATPSVADYFIAQQRKIPILRMTELATKSDAKSHISVIDLKDRNNFTRQHHLSNQLLDAIEQTLQRGEQALVFLNRRGTARLVLCQDCGWQALCPRCDLPLTYHGDNHTMQCHTCGHKEKARASCPVCKSAEITFKSIGTKLIAHELEHAFPNAVIRRFDTDNTKAERLEQHYDDIKAGKVDILVGTQMLAKGLDLPRLSLVGVVLADTTLYFPDYTASERTYQLLTQVLGRIGRGHRDSSAIIQTYDPSSAVINAAVTKNWQLFYEQEIAERQTFTFPPFCYTLKLSVERASATGAAAAARKLAATLRTNGLKIEVNGPAPAFHARVNGKYRWQLIIKAKDRSELLKVIGILPAKWSYDIDPMNLL